MASWADSADDSLNSLNAPPPPSAKEAALAAVKTAAPAEVGDGGQLALPETQVIVGKGVKTLIEWYINAEGKRIKKTTKYKLVQVPCRVKKAVIERRSAALFGKAVTQGNGGGITRMDGEVEIAVTAKLKALEAEAAFREAWKQRKQASSEKWGTRDYSKKQEADAFWDKAREDYYGADGGGAAAPDGTMRMRDQGKGTPGAAYVAPAARAGAGSKMTEGSRFGRRDEADTVRITNLSEEATENDVQELCRNFGAISRIYVAKDKHTGQSKGFAFVNFHRHDDAERAISKLNGYGYDNLILHVEWAKPSNPDGAPRDKPMIRSVAAT